MRSGSEPYACAHEAEVAVEIQEPGSRGADDEDEAQSEYVCAICASLFVDPVTLGCGHSLCLQCCEQLVRASPQPRCPCCRAPFPRRPLPAVSIALRNTVQQRWPAAYAEREREQASGAPSDSPHQYGPLPPSPSRVARAAEPTLVAAPPPPPRAQAVDAQRLAAALQGRARARRQETRRARVSVSCELLLYVLWLALSVTKLVFGQWNTDGRCDDDRLLAPKRWLSADGATELFFHFLLAFWARADMLQNRPLLQEQRKRLKLRLLWTVYLLVLSAAGAVALLRDNRGCEPRELFTMLCIALGVHFVEIAIALGVLLVSEARRLRLCAP